MSPTPLRSITAALAALLLSACAGGPNDDTRCGPCSAYPSPPEMAICPVLESGSGRWRNLAFQGGGVKGIAYGGALIALHEAGELDAVEEVAGTSAGASTAAMLAMGYNACEIAAFAGDFDYAAMADGSTLENLDRFVEQYGLHSGDLLQCTVRCMVQARLGDPEADFADLERARASGEDLRGLHIVVTDLTHEAPLVFSADSDFAQVPIAEAVRKSMSIPLFFRAQTLPPDDRLIVDGGVVLNYPIGLFDGEACADGDPREGPECRENPATLGLHIGSDPAASGPVRGLPDYLGRLLTTLTEAQIADLCSTPVDVARTLFIDTGGVRATDFDLTSAQRAALTEAGRVHARAFLADGPVEVCPPWVWPWPQ